MASCGSVQCTVVWYGVEYGTVGVFGENIGNNLTMNEKDEVVKVAGVAGCVDDCDDDGLTTFCWLGS